MVAGIMVEIKLTRTLHLPDPMRLALYHKAPELGPKVLLFSGGSALRGVSQRLIDYTHNSIHLITPFDSGGSSAKLRDAFHMLAVGDLRNRLMALADRSVQGQPEVLSLFAYRFPTNASQDKLRRWLRQMVRGLSPQVAAVSEPMQTLICNHLSFFEERMPDTFDLRGANIGNLILAGGYLNQDHHIDPVIFLFSKLAEVRGVVRPTSSEYLHLAAELEDGRVVVEQHRMTGKEVRPLTAPIKQLFLTRRRRRPEPVELRVTEKVAGHIRAADLICYPMGSFYTSLIANLLPVGVGQAISETTVPKVFIPNTGPDPEQIGLNLSGAVASLLKYLRAGCDEPVEISDLLNVVVVDRRYAELDSGQVAEIEQLGVSVVDAPLVTDESAPMLDDDRVVKTLLSLV